MGDLTGIAWTDKTMNFWLGCTEASDAGCATCYAREQDKRYQWGIPKEQATANRAAGIAPHWGPGAPRHRTAESNWAKPLRWNNEARLAGITYMVFSSSLSDFFDKEVDPRWRAAAWKVIKGTQNLRWQILTKRVPNIKKMLPEDWGRGYPNVGLMASCVTQAEYDRDRGRLMRVPAVWHGFSFEPQVERIQLRPELFSPDDSVWIITGGDSAQPTSGLEPRPYDIRWARDLINTKRFMPNMRLFVKQLGARPVGAPPQGDQYAGENIDDWPADLRVREFPPEVLS